MTLDAIAKALGISHGSAYNFTQAGMPADDIEAARRWHILRAQNKRRRRLLPEPGDVNPADFKAGELDEVIPRMRRLEKALAHAAEQAYEQGKVTEAIALRREHVAAVKTLLDGEAKLIKINEARGRLISVDRALGLINEALQSAILVLRRLPELGRDAEERKRLEAFLNGVLAEIKIGAAEGLKHAA